MASGLARAASRPSIVDNLGRLARLGAVGLLMAGLAIGGTPRPAVAAPVGGCADTAASRASAVALAVRCKQRVEDLSARTLTGQQFANPDGTHTSVESAVPVRVKRPDGSWVPVDLTLVRGADGSVAPAATVTPVTLSGGGGGPLATVYAGALYRVNPLDQPGVELGKKLAKESLASVQAK